MASTRLTRTNTGTITNNKKFTLSFWMKRSIISTAQETVFGSYPSGTSNDYVYFPSGDQLGFFGSISGSQSVYLLTTRVFRDVSAWYHIVIAVDTTQATSSDRVKIYVNGVQETAFDQSSYPSQNVEFRLAKASNTQEIGCINNGNHFDGLLTHFHFIDGTQYAASNFGSTDSTTGEWKINTAPSVTYGTNGFFVLKDGNSVTDQSGNSNNFTVAAGTLSNTEDCPSNVFATGNPLVMNPSHTGTFSNGNNKLVSTAGGKQLLVSTLAANSGKFYAEYKADDVGGGTMIGVIPYDVVVNTLRQNNYFGQDNGSVCMYSVNGAVYNPPTASGITGVSYTNGDIIGVAVDLDNSYCYFHKNGTYINSGDPTSGSTGTGGTPFTKGDSLWCFAGGDSTDAGGSVATTSANFGNGYFGTTAISSEGTNASNIGKFEYDVPTGYTALSTKGLNE